jgi:hypothetical protein
MEWVAIFNIIAPHVFGAIAAARQSDPKATYRQALLDAGIRLDPEQARLLAEMEQAVRDGAVPR